jgi:hypothetical protein
VFQYLGVFEPVRAGSYAVIPVIEKLAKFSLMQLQHSEQPAARQQVLLLTDYQLQLPNQLRAQTRVRLSPGD